MDLTELINQAARLINQASAYNGAGETQQATEDMNKLRDMLNDPTKLEAGGGG